jgi:hypothetical protein
MNKMTLRFAGLGSFVERPATKAAIAQASLSAARRDARSDVARHLPTIKTWIFKILKIWIPRSDLSKNHRFW